VPIYLYKCEKCGNKTEVIQGIAEGTPFCCGKLMVKLPTSPAMIKMKGMDNVLMRSEGYKEGYSKEYLKSLNKT